MKVTLLWLSLLLLLTGLAEAAPQQGRLKQLAEELRLARDDTSGSAQALGLEALGWLEEQPAPKVEYAVLIDLSWITSRSGDSGAGLEYAKKARKVATTLKDASKIARADYHIALAYWYEGSCGDAIRAAERAIATCRRLKKPERLAKALTLLGSVHRSQSDYDEAMECHFEALELSLERGDDAAVARSRNNIALVYWNLGDHEHALEMIRMVVETYRELGDEAKIQSALSNFGLLMIEAGNPEEALPVLAEALEIDERSSNARMRAKLLSNVGFAQQKLERFDEALASMEASLDMWEELGDQWGMARILGSIAELHQSQERFEQALEYYERAEVAAEAAGARDELSHILRRMAEVQEELGEYPAAFVTLRRHVKVHQDLDLAQTARRISELESAQLLSAQELQVDQERFVRNAVLGGALAVLVLGALGWNLFLLKRRSHRKLEAMHQRLSAHATELEEARGKIETLEELLPICSYCKSIRDEVGEWHQLEAYLHTRGGAQLTHGICPGCYTRAARTN